MAHGYKQDACQRLWYQALEQELGIAVEPSDKPSFLNCMYDARISAADPELEKIVICNPKGKEVFLVKKTVELD